MSNLLEKASIVTTPTAYDNGKILSVKPNTSVGDFDFTRNSSATRVNSQGLIEDVQILSSNLVSNGDFSQEGSEEVTNGDFATDSDWTKDAGWTISNGTASCNGSGVNSLQQSGITTVGKIYKLTFDVLDSNNFNFLVISANFGDTYVDADLNNAVVLGKNTFYIKPTNGTGIRFRVSNGTTLSIDNVSVKEVGQGWEFNSTAILTANGMNITTGGYIRQDVVTIGKSYKLTYDIFSYTSGDIRLYDGTNQGSLPTSIGSNTFNFIAGGSNLVIQSNSVNVNLVITNISVIEITDDTNLPRIDYTGGTGHWLFEPQSTNLVTYSEDFSQWAFVGSATQTPNYSTSPNNFNNATMLNVLSGYIRLSITGKTSSSNQSIFVKRGGSNPATHIRLTSNNTSAWNTGSSLKYELTDDWTRINVQDGILTSSAFIIIGSVDETNTMDSDCNGTSLIWGAQVEDQSYPTSYIPTNGSTVTRLQDAAFGAGSSDLINSTEGVLYAEIAALADDNSTRVIQLSDGTNSNRIFIGYWSLSNEIRMLVQVGGVTQAFSGNTSYDILDFNKIAFKYKESDFALWINGTEIITDTSGITFPIGTLTQLDFDSNGSAIFFGKTKCVAVYKEALTDAELTCLTTI